MTDAIDEWTGTIHEGDAMETLREMPAESVHAVITSPPYWGLRDYGDATEKVWGGDPECDHEFEPAGEMKMSGGTEETGQESGEVVYGNTDDRAHFEASSDFCTECGAWRGQLGLEPTFDMYVDHLVAIGKEVHRVLRDDGVWWLNLGDTYTGGGGIKGVPDDWESPSTANREKYPDDPPAKKTGLPHKCKTLIPHRVAIALEEEIRHTDRGAVAERRGWLVRNDVVWNKTSAMPESVTDRLAQRFEYVFMLTKRSDYWFDLDAIREPHAKRSRERMSEGPINHSDRQTNDDLRADQLCHPNGKNPGDVWEEPTANYPEAHYAVFPEALVERPLLASVPPRVCAECGTPYDRETAELGPLENPNDRPQKAKAIERYEASDLTEDHLEAVRTVGITDADYGQATSQGFDKSDPEAKRLAREAQDVLGSYAREFISPGEEHIGWTQGCDCETDETEPGIVLDPFAGRGTTCAVAAKNGRRYVGIDMDPDALELAEEFVPVGRQETFETLGQL